MCSKGLWQKTNYTLFSCLNVLPNQYASYTSTQKAPYQCRQTFSAQSGIFRYMLFLHRKWYYCVQHICEITNNNHSHPGHPYWFYSFQRFCWIVTFRQQNNIFPAALSNFSFVINMFWCNMFPFFFFYLLQYTSTF